LPLRNTVRLEPYCATRREATGGTAFVNRPRAHQLGGGFVYRPPASPVGSRRPISGYLFHWPSTAARPGFGLGAWDTALSQRLPTLNSTSDHVVIGMDPTTTRRPPANVDGSDAISETTPVLHRRPADGRRGDGLGRTPRNVYRLQRDPSHPKPARRRSHFPDSPRLILERRRRWRLDREGAQMRAARLGTYRGSAEMMTT